MIDGSEDWLLHGIPAGVPRSPIDPYVPIAIPAENPPQPVAPGGGLPTTDQDRKALPLWTYMMEYFPDAFVEACKVSVIGNNQHNPGQPLHWAREKSTDQMNTAFRHMWDHSRGVTKDVDGAYHLAKAIWRLKAELQLTIEREREESR